MTCCLTWVLLLLVPAVVELEWVLEHRRLELELGLVACEGQRRQEVNSTLRLKLQE